MDPGTRRNILTYYVNFVVVAAVGFIVNPLLLTALGPLLFGVWKSLQRYLDFATVADGRASQALKWVVASRTNLADPERRKDVGAAIIVWCRWLPAAALVATGVTLAVPLLIRGLPHDALAVTYAAAAVLAANTVLAGLLSIPDAVLTGVNQGYKSMLVTTAVFVSSNAAMIFAAFVDWPLWSLAVIVLTAAIVNSAITLIVAKRAVVWWGLSRPTKSDVRRVFGYSTWTLGWVVVDKLFMASELIVISIMLGALEVTRYTFTAYVMQFVLSISLVTASGFMPMLGTLLGSQDLQAAAHRAKAVRHLVIGLATLGSSAVLAFNSRFVSMWVGDDQYLGANLNVLLVVLGLQLALIRMDGQILDVTMRIAPKVIVGLVSSAGGIAAGCLAYAVTHDLVIALLAVILLRFVSSVGYPMLVNRSIPRSAPPGRVAVLATALLALSGAIGFVAQLGNWPLVVGLAVLWALAVATCVWCGLVPLDTLRALVRRQAR